MTANDGAFPADASVPVSASTNRGEVLGLTGAGVWQVHYLPQEWRDQHLAGRDVQIAYVLLAAPHRIDLDGAFSPCGPPSRIVLGVVDRRSAPKEHLARCLHYCDKSDGVAGTVHRGLWGSFTQLEGASMRIIKGGAIDVAQHYRERVFAPPAEAQDPLALEKTPLGTEVKIRHDIIAPEEFLFSTEEAGACRGGGEAE